MEIEKIAATKPTKEMTITITKELKENLVISNAIMDKIAASRADRTFNRIDIFLQLLFLPNSELKKLCKKLRIAV